MMRIIAEYLYIWLGLFIALRLYIYYTKRECREQMKKIGPLTEAIPRTSLKELRTKNGENERKAVQLIEMLMPSIIKEWTATLLSWFILMLFAMSAYVHLSPLT